MSQWGIRDRRPLDEQIMELVRFRESFLDEQELAEVLGVSNDRLQHVLDSMHRGGKLKMRGFKFCVAGNG